MHQGTVIFFLETKAFGFIKPQSSDKDIFFHRSHVAQSDVDAIRAGSRVQFEIGTSEKGRLQALHVRLLEQQEAEATSDALGALAWEHRKDET